MLTRAGTSARTELQPRKKPRQTRSQRMKEDLLEAAARVLARDGARRFTTNRVAEAAGASVGSLYQYFPNKAALLVALHERDALAAWKRLEAILVDAKRSPRARFEVVVVEFFRIQFEAAEHHQALGDAQVPVSLTPDFLVLEQLVVARLQTFLGSAARRPRMKDPAFAAWFAFTVATSVGERIAARQVEMKKATRIGVTIARMLADALGLAADQESSP
jgi:AcrR family transcriptional regulator